jgi:hypothetical protein
MKWMRGIVLVIVLLAPSASAMNCQLARDIQDASETRTFYLQGVYDKTTSVVEKTTLEAEIDALVALRENAVSWILENCK